MTTQIEAMKMALEDLVAVLCDPEGVCCFVGSPGDRALAQGALSTLRAAIEAAEKCEPDGYIEIEIYDGIQDFGFAASFEQGVLDHIKDEVLRFIDEDIAVPEMYVKPFYLHPPSAEIESLRKDVARYRWLTKNQYHKVYCAISGMRDVKAMCLENWIDSAINAAMQEKQP